MAKTTVPSTLWDGSPQPAVLSHRRPVRAVTVTPAPPSSPATTAVTTSSMANGSSRGIRSTRATPNNAPTVISIEEKSMPADANEQEPDTEADAPADNAKLPKSGTGSSAKVTRDEIVVNTIEVKGASPPPTSPTADQDDIIIADASNADRVENQVDKEELLFFRRKRLVAPTRATRGPGRPPNASSTQAQPRPFYAVLGYWRESPVPNQDRHTVIGFIDAQDCLRTYVHNVSRSGQSLSTGVRVPAGLGNTPVTFEQVVFEQHLIGLNQNEMKEYVRLLTDPVLLAEMATMLEQPSRQDVVRQAIRRAAQNPATDNPFAPHIAYGADLPDYVVNANKRQRLGSPDLRVPLPTNTGLPPPLSPVHVGEGTFPPSLATARPRPALPGPLVPTAAPVQQSALIHKPTTRPTKILVGLWRGSSEDREQDKHAVFGVLDQKDLFRLKVTRETRDGRPVQANFPTGAEFLWVHFEEVDLEPHLRLLTRLEIKSYVRIRQCQLDGGEPPSQTAENECRAVLAAQAAVRRCKQSYDHRGPSTRGCMDINAVAPKPHMNGEANVDFPQSAIARLEGQSTNQSGYQQHNMPLAAAAVAAAATANQRSLPAGTDPAAIRQSQLENSLRVEQTNSLARREVVRMESMQMRNDQRAIGCDAQGSVADDSGSANVALGTGGPAESTGIGANTGEMSNADTNVAGSSSRQAFKENIDRLNKVWAAQEAARLRGGGEDAKIYKGIKYERRLTGPFQGKLVSPGTILSIDGEDYVEYRVLTKPSFF